MKVIHKQTFAELLALEDDSTPLDPDIILLGDPRWESALDDFEACAEFGCDIETKGVEKYDPLFYRKGSIRLIQIGLSDGRVIIADLGAFGKEINPYEVYPRFIKLLKTKLECRKTVVLGVNFKFDYVFLMYQFGIRTRNCRDIMLISQVLHAGVGVLSVKGGVDRKERCLISHGLKGVAERYGEEVDKTEQTSNWGWDLSNSQLNYAAKDVKVLFPLRKKMTKDIMEMGCKFPAYMESQALTVFAEMEYFGVPIDIEKTKSLKARYEEAIVNTLKPFTDSFPGVNHSSGPDLLKALRSKYPELGLESTGIEVLGPLDLPETNAVLKTRTLETSLAFLDGVLEFSWANKPGELVSTRGFYRQMTPSGTGRSSCTDKIKKVKQGMSLQVTPGKIDGSGLPGVRSVISPPEGYVLGIVDLSASHARIATELSQSVLLKDIYNNDFDGHSILASFLATLCYEEYNRLIKDNPKAKITDSMKNIMESMEYRAWTPEDIKKLKKSNEFAKGFRSVAKTTLYSSLNGSAKGTILRATKAAGYIWFTDELATKAANHFAEMYPELVNFCKNTPKKAVKEKFIFDDFKTIHGKKLDAEHGIVRGLTGRYCYFAKKYGTMDWNKDKLEVAYTDSISANWFLVESDILDDWAFNLQIELDKFPYGSAYIANQVHDEIVILAKKKYAQEAITAAIWHQIKAFRKWIHSIPVIEDGPFAAGPTKEGDYEIFEKWVNTPRGKDNLTPWQECMCKDYSEK